MRMVAIRIEVTDVMFERLNREGKTLGMEAADLASLLLWSKLWEHGGDVKGAVIEACYSGLANEREPR